MAGIGKSGYIKVVIVGVGQGLIQRSFKRLGCDQLAVIGVGDRFCCPGDRSDLCPTQIANGIKGQALYDEIRVREMGGENRFDLANLIFIQTINRKYVVKFRLSTDKL